MLSSPDQKSGQFPATRWSAIVAARSKNREERQRGFDAIIQAYWRPVYKSIRFRWQKSNEDAQDLTQSFFLNVMEKESFSTYDPARGRFRTYLRTCLDRFLMNEHKASHRLKRGGQQRILSLDYESAERELSAQFRGDDLSFEDYFEREWVRGIFSMAIAELRQHLSARNKDVYFQIFEMYDLNDDTEKITYHFLAEKFDLPVTKVTNYLSQTRREFREILMQKLRSVTVSDDEFNDELRALLGR